MYPSSSHLNNPQIYLYDPLHLFCRRSPALLWPPFPRPQGRLQAQKFACNSSNLASPFDNSLISRGFSLDPCGVYRDSSCRDGVLSRRSHGRAYRTQLQMRRGFSSKSHEKYSVFTCTDGALSCGNRSTFRQLGGMHRMCVRTYAFNPQNGGNGGGRTIFNLAGAGLLTYLTVTGRLNWLFDAIFSLWLVSAVLWWFAERTLIRGPCPNCGGEFQVFEFMLKEEFRLCPYCSQPFKLENKKFVRDEPQFSNQQTRGFKQPFGGFEGFGQPTTSRKKEDSSGVIVDIEAEVRDKD